MNHKTKHGIYKSRELGAKLKEQTTNEVETGNKATLNQSVINKGKVCENSRNKRTIPDTTDHMWTEIVTLNHIKVM